MSYPYRGNSERSSSKYSHRDNSLQKKREIEKKRREQQYNTEEAADVPVFSQPRKITSTERQDSLTRNINNVLGDPGVVGGILFREPNIWLGTSRSAQGQSQTGPAPKDNIISSSGMQYSSDKGGAGEQSERAGYSSSTKPLAHSDGSRTSDSRSGDRKHNQRLKHSRAVNQDNSNSLRSGRIDKSSYNLPSNSANWSYHDNADRSSRIHTTNDESAYSVRANGERDRISSVDSDLSGVENILKEMVEQPPPSITAIKTPSVNENKFNFTPTSQKKKLEGPESSVDSAANDTQDGDAGSDQDSSDDSSDDENTNVNKGWTLTHLMQEASNDSTVKDKRKRSSGEASTQSPKVPHLDSSRDDGNPPPTSKMRPKPSSSSKSSQSPRGRSTAPANNIGNMKQAMPKRTLKSSGSYESSPNHFVKSERKKNPGSHIHGTQDHSEKFAPAANDKKPFRSSASKASSRSNELKHSYSSSSSSDSSSSGESDGDSDSNEEDAKETSELLQHKGNARNSVSPNDSMSWNESRLSNVNVAVPNDSLNVKPAQDKGSLHRTADDSRNRSPAITTVKELANSNEKPRLYPSLWVKIKTPACRTDSNSVRNVPSKSSSEQHAAHSSKSPIPKKRQRGMVSVGSETEQPVRRTTEVEVAVAEPSTDWKKGTHAQKTVNDARNFPDKKTHRDDRHSKQRKSSPRVERRGSTSANNYESVPETNGCQSSLNKKQDSPSSSSRPSDVLPDSSLPGGQGRLETSDWYMKEAKRLKHEGDGMADSRTGRSREGEALTRALAYFEASLFFIMSGYVMESESTEDRMDSSNSSPHCPANMYLQTLPLLNFVLKMRPRVEQEDHSFKQINISCLRCQSFLYFRIFRLKKDIAISNSELLTKQFESMGKSGPTHSPWRNANAAPNVLSPMSPAVPSPYTHHGPSPAGSNSEQVSSSTQAGRMTPTSHSNYNLPQKTYDIYRQHHAIMCNLLQAHEKWDLAESMLEEHAGFFRNIDALCNITLTFHSSLRDVFHYHRMVLHQLRALMSGSPST